MSDTFPTAVLESTGHRQWDDAAHGCDRLPAYDLVVSAIPKRVREQLGYPGR